MRDDGGVLICGEHSEGKLASVTRELIAVGRRLADALDQELSAVLLGSQVDAQLARESIYSGADTVYVIDDPLLSEYLPDACVAALERLVRDTKPDIVLFAQTSMGRDAAPRLAYRLDTGVTLDCVELAIDPETRLMRQTKPVYGGNAHAIYVCRSKPQMASVRPKTTTALERDEARTGAIIQFGGAICTAEIRTKLIRRVKEEMAGVKLEDADVVVCGGRGIGGPEGFARLEELARLLKGAVGATRPPCEIGWVPAHCQIGLTGRIVSPTLYVGVALSGSSQHLAGMSGSKHIVAINKDPDANIFSLAHFGVVGDYQKVLPAFFQKCKEDP
ncbi:MAG: electron transfer flavoprotein subunit alpha [Deltaproteobacteria bacterium]|nr:electron transfer flavoprotein subunit alpha [Deltaproteobacteria bacterium]